jgi:mono/diheme cytochrome c family protein
MNRPIAATLGLGLLLLAGCSQEESAPPATGVARTFDPAVLVRGDELYHEHCAECHGPDAQGHPDWQTPSNGTFTAAPPLNGTGHEHERAKSALVAAIKNGISKNGEPVMPAWAGRLNDEQIEQLMQWLESQWPPEVYQSWRAAGKDRA